VALERLLVLPQPCRRRDPQEYDAMKQAVRVDDDDDGGMDVAAYVCVLLIVLLISLSVAAFLWWAHGRGL
jgi:hypothetical protein